MSDVAVFIFGSFVTLLCSAAVGMLIYGAAQEREDERLDGRRPVEGKAPLERIPAERRRVAPQPGVGI